MSTSLKSQKSASIGTTAVAIGGYTAPSVTTGVVVTGLVLTNQVATTITATCYVVTGGTNYYLCVNATILPGGNLVLADEGNRMTLTSGDQVFVLSNTASSISALMSVAEIT